MPSLWFQMGEVQDWVGYDRLLAKDAEEAGLTEDSFEDREKRLLKKERIDNSNEGKLILLPK
jgi:hypothetical protein